MKNELYFRDDSIVRVLEVREDRVLVIDCIRRTMPQWKELVSLAGWEKCSEEKLYEIADVDLPEIDSLCSESRKVAYERYTMIAPILRLLLDEKKEVRNDFQYCIQRKRKQADCTKISLFIFSVLLQF